MPLFVPRTALLVSVRAVLAAAALVGAAHGASAGDGLQGFLSSIFGGTPEQAPPAAVEQPMPASPVHRYRSRPLVVRLHPAKPRLAVLDAPTKTGPVSIFEDRTLRRGDAVMTKYGVRVFAGSASWPYRSEDFVALDEDHQLSKSTVKVLAQLDKVPHN